MNSFLIRKSKRILNSFRNPLGGARRAVILLLAAQPCFAANHYVLKTATGNGSGGDWTNACTDFIGSCSASGLVRGDIYYVASGTYASVIFSTPTSGSLEITIKRATVIDHGTNSGWNNAYDGQVTWNFGAYENVAFQTSHWVFDGMTGPGWPTTGGSSVSNYGFLLAQPSGCNIPNGRQDGISIPPIEALNNTVSDVTIRHVAGVGCGPSYGSNEQAFFVMGGVASDVSSIYVGYTYGVSWGGFINSTNNYTSTFEHNWWEHEWSSSAHHGDAVAAECTLSNGCPGNVYRYNYFNDCEGTGCIVGLDCSGCQTVSILNWEIYGNVFANWSFAGGNGVITTGTSGFVIAGTRIYNNTFYNIPVQIFMQCEPNGDPSCSSATGNVFENNILYLSTSTLVQNGGGAITNDYNSYLSATDSGNSETHGQIVTLNPFVIAPTVNGPSANYQLSNDGVASCASITATCTGLVLASPYNLDANGITRGADGSWERGAFEFSSGVNASPPPPTSLIAIVN